MLTIGLLSPGEMGHAIGAVLGHHGVRVITCLEGRSDRTAERAERAGITAVPDDETLVSEADVLFSVLAPALARSLAERVARALGATGATLLYADCNAIAPRTVREVEATMLAAGAGFVDVGIVGGPPKLEGPGPRLYASGPAVDEFVKLGDYGLDIRVLGPESGQASGFKMCYGALTKGLTALATEVLVAGRALGLAEPLTAELQASQAGLLSWMERQIPTMPPKSGRWVGEMEEIAATLDALGLPPQLHLGAAALYDWVSQTPLGDDRTADGIIERLAGALPSPTP